MALKHGNKSMGFQDFAKIMHGANLMWQNTPPAPTLVGYTNDLTYGKAFFASSQYDYYGPEMAFDDQEGNVWYGGVDTNDYVGVDFGAGVTKKIERLRFRSGRLNGFNLDGSNDFSNWTTVYSGNRTNSSAWQTFDFANQTGYRYYRIKGTGAQYAGGVPDNIETEMMEGIYE